MTVRGKLAACSVLIVMSAAAPLRAQSGWDRIAPPPAPAPAPEPVKPAPRRPAPKRTAPPPSAPATASAPVAAATVAAESAPAAAVAPETPAAVAPAPAAEPIADPRVDTAPAAAVEAAPAPVVATAPAAPDIAPVVATAAAPAPPEPVAAPAPVVTPPAPTAKPAVAPAPSAVAARAAAATTAAPPDDTPSIKVGATIFGDYTYTQSPESTDSDSNTIHASAFNLVRSYINITGNISHVVTFRITPDVVRQSALLNTATAAGVSNDSLVLRLKYAFAQINLDDWMAKGSWVRFGVQQMPLLDYEEGIYRYRFQGTLFAEREGFFSSADAGASFHYNFPANFGDLHAGVYNGEGYAKAERNDQKAIEVRGTVRPFAKGAPLLRGLRVTTFYYGDHAVRDAEKTRLIQQATFEHKYVNAGFDYVRAADQSSATGALVESRGWSFFVTPKSPSGWEGLIRYDHLTPDLTKGDQTRSRTILGVAYWFPHKGGPTSALLLDYDSQSFANFTPAPPKQTRIAVHCLVNF